MTMHAPWHLVLASSMLAVLTCTPFAPALGAGPTTCERSRAVPNEELAEAIDVALEEWEAEQLDAFEKKADEVFDLVGCLDEPVAPKTAARVHLLRGLKWYGAGNYDLAAKAFAASRLSYSGDPGLPDKLTEEERIQQRYRELALDLLAYREVGELADTPATRRIFLDGHPVGDRFAAELPTIRQVATVEDKDKSEDEEQVTIYFTKYEVPPLQRDVFTPLPELPSDARPLSRGEKIGIGALAGGSAVVAGVGAMVWIGNVVATTHADKTDPSFVRPSGAEFYGAPQNAAAVASVAVGSVGVLASTAWYVSVRW